MKLIQFIILSCIICPTGLATVNSQNLSATGGKTNQVNDNSGYDVLKYKLEFNSNPESKDFSGKTTVYFKVLNAADQIEFDAENNLEIKEVTYKNQVITNYKHENKKLKIHLPAEMTLDATDTISIAFAGDADQSSGYFATSVKYDKEFWVSYTFSQYKGTAASWWVCKDGLTDKADEVELHITHPSSYKAVANGLLTSKNDNK